MSVCRYFGPSVPPPPTVQYFILQSLGGSLKPRLQLNFTPKTFQLVRLKKIDLSLSPHSVLPRHYTFRFVHALGAILRRLHQLRKGARIVPIPSALSLGTLCIMARAPSAVVLFFTLIARPHGGALRLGLTPIPLLCHWPFFRPRARRRRVHLGVSEERYP